MPASEILTTWSLEVVRGAKVGRLYPVPPGETVLGNARNGTVGIDLADQEGSGPRRMAARQARLQCSGQSLSLFDLGSPGGTFVNRERLVPFQARQLRPGDVVQLASVQLRVVHGANGPAGTTSHAPPGPAVETAATGAGPIGAPGAFLFTLKAGPVCRTWDDFLTVSAQRWNDLRDELTSGRLAAFLVANGRAALAPDPDAPGDADQRLDAWLATLPTRRTATPELEVHPESITLTAASGGTIRRAVTISNAGYRLLTTTARIEPAGTPWLSLAEPHRSGPFTTVERTELGLDVTIPDRLDGPRSAAVVLESNGGTRRVSITVEPPRATEAAPEAGFVTDRAAPSAAVGAWLARITRRTRLIGGAAAGLLGRLALGLSALAAGDGLLGPLLLGALLGAIGGLALSRRRGQAPDLPYGLFAGAFGGMLLAELAVIATRAVESLSGADLPLVAACVLWGLLGAALAGLSELLVPHEARTEGS
jgi:hypothetical protein